MKFRRNLSLLIIVFAFFAVSASAQDFYWNSASTRSLALGGVYVPSTSDAIGALTTNPAGLTYLSGPTLDLSMSAVFARGSFSNSVNNNAPMTTSPGVIPYGAFGMPIGNADQLRRWICPRHGFGFGLALCGCSGICRSHLRDAGTKISDSCWPRYGWHELCVYP